MPPLWTVEFSQRAAADFDDIILHTFKNFGQPHTASIHVFC